MLPPAHHNPITRPSGDPANSDVAVLDRVVRFAVVPPADLDAAIEHSSNGFAGRPRMRGFGRHYQLLVRCRAAIDPRVQYVVDIKDVDRAARATIIPAICRACQPPTPPAPFREFADSDIASVLRFSLPDLNAALGGIVLSAELFLSPYYRVSMSTADPSSVLLRQRFDFAASHRLHNPALSDAENQARFGKCNNPRGHGHNYQFEPCIRVPLSDSGVQAFTLEHLESIADRVIIDRFDHKHLNEDTTEFNIGAGGVLPTVENIARVFYAMLGDAVAAHEQGGPNASLVSVTVWETDRTSATYPG